MMNLTRYDPISALHQLQEDVNRLLGRDPAKDEESNIATSSWMPAVDIKEEDQQFVIDADVPGVDPKDIEVTMENGLLTIKGERSEETKDESKGYHRVERSWGSFYRRFSLPDSADNNKISAKSMNGVLRITIPKHAVVKPKTITVQS